MSALLFRCSIALLTLVSFCSADLSDNQIENDELGRPPTRDRFAVRACKPCGPNQCQVMGMQRFAEPRCEAFGGLGAPCRPFSEAENKTLSFPGNILYCSDVYMQFCPCARNLVCDLERAECRRATTRTNAKRTTTSTTRRPARFQWQQQQAANANTNSAHHPFGESEPEAETAPDRGAGLPVDFELFNSNLVPRELAQGARRRPQWPWAVARFH